MRKITQKWAFMLMTLLCCIAMPQVVTAQTCVEIGEGTTAGSASLPVASWYHYSYTQQLFTADEIEQGSGNIVSVGFQYNNASSMTRKISIFMANTDVETFGTNFIREDLEEVLPPTVVTFSNEEDWVVIDLETPFAYTGENLVVAVYQEQSAEETLYSSGSRFLTFSSTGMARYKQVDSQFVLGDDNAPSDAGSEASYRTNIQLCFTGGSGGPTCDKPSALVPSDTTAHEITLTWSDGSGVYNVEYQVKGDSVWTRALSNTTLLTTTITGLKPSTDYQARVQSVCADTVSGWKTAAFKTSIGLPYDVNFDNWTTISSGDWKMYTGLLSSVMSGTALSSATSGWTFTSSTTGVFKSKHIYTNIYGSSWNKWIVTPAIPLDGNAELSFTVALTDVATTEGPITPGKQDDDKFVVLITTNGGATWAILRQWDDAGSQYVYENISYNGEDVVLDLSAYNGETVQIAFYGESTVATSGGDSYLHIDNVLVDYIPSCLKPTDLFVVANSATQTSVQLDWTANTAETAWKLAYKKASVEVWDTIDVAAKPFTLTGLEAYTAYDVQVAAVCDPLAEDGISKFSKPIQIKTVATIPFAEGFNTAFPSDWKRYYGDLAGVISGDSTLEAANAGWNCGTGNGVFTATDKHLILNIYGTACKYWVVSPIIEMEDNVQLTFDLALTKFSGTLTPVVSGEQDDDKFYVLITADGGQSWEALKYWDNQSSLDPFDGINCSADGQTVLIDLSAYAGQNVQLAFYGESTVEPTSGGDNNLHIDNILVDYIPACAKPLILDISNVTSAAATFTWDEDENANWEYCYLANAALDSVPAADLFTAIDTNMVVISGLAENTAYTFYLRRDCGADKSEILAKGFKTTQIPTAVPYSDDFETANNWLFVNGDLINQWCYGTAAHNGEGTHALYISNDNGVTNAYTVSVTTGVVVYATKLFDIAEDGTYTIKYDWNAKGESSSDYLRVVLVPSTVVLEAGTTLPTGLSTTAVPQGWIAIDGGSKLNMSSSWQTVSVDAELEAGQYNVVFVWRNDYSVGTQPPAAIDNFSITRLLCARPEDVALAAGGDSIATTSAVIDWEAQGTEANWLLQYKKSTDEEWIEIDSLIKAHPYTLAGLKAATSYDVRVAAWCNPADSATISEYSESFTFATECDAIAEFPYSENFDGVVGKTSGNVLPICWDYINTCTSTSYNYYPMVYAGSSYAASGTNALKFYSYYSSSSTTADPQDQYAILPEMEGLSALRMKFKARANGTSAYYDATFTVGVMSDPADTATFVPVATMEPTSTTYAPFEVKFNNYTGAGKYIAIKMEAAGIISSSHTYGYRGFYLDDIVIDSIPDCYEPVALKVLKTTTTGVQFTFTAAEESNDSLSYAIVAKGAQPTAYIGVTADTMTVNGLTAATEYELYLRSECTNSHSKAISAPFMTKLLPIDLGNGFADDFEGALQWQLENGSLENQWVVDTATHNGAGNHALYISNDGGKTNAYTVTQTATVFAVKPFNIAAGTYVFQYDWRAYGEGSSDYIRVALVPDSVEFAAGTTLPSGVTTTALPANCIALDGGSKLNLSSVWDTLQTAEIKVKAGTYNVVFMWRNDYSVGTMPPAAIDNFSIVKILCGKPGKPTIDKANITSNSAEIVWEAEDGQTAWQIAMDTLKNFNPDSVAPIAANKDTFTVDGLLPEHTYYVYVRSNCGADGFSEWSDVASFKTAKACQKPDGVVISAITDSSAVVTWNTYGQSDFRLTYGIGNAYADSVNVTGGTYTINGLEANTSYKVKIASDCDLNTWSSVKTFKTRCEPAASLTDNFDGITGVTSGHAMTECWDYINNGTNSSYNYYPTVYKGTSYANSGENSLKFYSYYSSTATTTIDDQYAILPALNNVSGLRMKFNARKYSASYDATITLGVMTNPEDAATFVAIDTVSPATAAYAPFVVMFDGYTGDGKYIAIKMDKAAPVGTATSAYRGIHIDDVVVEAIPSCLEPSDLVALETGLDSAKLDWVSGASAWQICLNNDSVNLIDVNAKPFVLSNLSPSQKYTFMVRAICAVGDTSAWSIPEKFFTECGAISLAAGDYVQDFEDVDATTYDVAGELPVCWLNGGNTTKALPHVVQTGSYAYKHSGLKSLNFCGSAKSNSYVALPSFEEALSNTQISFWMQAESASYGTLSIGYITAADTGSFATYVPVDSFPNNTGSMVMHELMLNNLPAEADRLAFRWQYTGTSFYSCCIDSVVVSLIPPCPKSTGLHAVEVADTTATFGWDAEADVTWECGIVVDTAAGFAPADADFTVVADTNFVTIGGLTENTAYLFFMRKVCGDDKSIVLYSKFTTVQTPAAIPFFDDFENGNSWLLLNDTLINAWVVDTAAHFGEGNHALYISNDGGATHAYTNNKAAAVYATKAIRVEEDGKYTFSYDWLANGESTYDYIRIALVPASVELTAGTTLPSGVSSSALPAGWIAIDGGSKLNLATAWQQKVVSAIVSAGIYKVVILWRDDTGGGTNPPAAIDNFSIVQELCAVPTDLNASDVTTSSATLNWTSDASAWELVYSENADFVPAEATPIAVTSKPYILGNLLPETSYYYAVRAKCDDNFYSAWSAISTFATPKACVPEYEIIYDTICLGETITFGDRVLSEAGTYVDSLTNIEGCDSIVTLNLSIYASESTIYAFDSIGVNDLPYTYEAPYITDQLPIHYDLGTQPGTYTDSAYIHGEHCPVMLVLTLKITEAQGINNINGGDGKKVQKVLYRDIMYIIVEDEWYNAAGQKVNDPRK